MLHERLELESRRTRRRHFGLALALAGCAAVIAAFLFGLVAVGPVSRDAPSGREASAPAPAPSAPVPSSSVSAPAPLAPASAPSAPVPPPSAPASAPAPAPEPPVDAAAERAREAFKSALGTFRAEIEPAAAHPDFARWNPAARREILDGGDAAVARFGEGAYGEALEILSAAAAAARREFAARDAAFDAALAGAREARDGYDPDAAARGVARALAIRPDSPEALELAADVEKLPALAAAVEDAAAARAGNDLAAEERHLAAALAIDGTRRALADRLETVRGALRDRRFAAAVDAGLESVRARDPAAARRHLATARSLRPGRGETGLLAGEIAALEAALAVEGFVARALGAVALDDWPAAERAYADALRHVPGDGDLGVALADAREVNGLRRDVERHLGAPRRLASPDVAPGVRALLDRAARHAARSPSLARRAGELADLVDAYAVPVPVRVISDGKTDIKVRGVGVVGATTGKTVRLRPGRYVFVGTRPGFRSKSVAVEVSPGDSGLVLEVIPDERI